MGKRFIKEESYRQQGGCGSYILWGVIILVLILLVV